MDETKPAQTPGAIRRLSALLRELLGRRTGARSLKTLTVRASATMAAGLSAAFIAGGLLLKSVIL